MSVQSVNILHLNHSTIKSHCDPLGPQMKRVVNACKPAEASHAWRYKSNSTSKYGKSDHHLIIQCLSFWVSNNSANNYIHYQVERQDFITILQGFLGKHWHLPRLSTWKIRGFAKSRPAANHGPAARRPSGPRPTARRPSPDFPQFFVNSSIVLSVSVYLNIIKQTETRIQNFNDFNHLNSFTI